MKSFNILLYAGAVSVTFFVFFSFAFNAFQRFAYFYPVSVRMESPLGIDPDSEIELVFNQPVVMFSSENVLVEPVAEFEFEFSNDRKILKMKSDAPLLAGTKYKLSIRNARGLSGLLLDKADFIFYTSEDEARVKKMELEKRKAHYAVLELSKNRYIPPESSRPKIEIDVEPKFAAGKYIDVSLDHQIMTLFEEGIKVNSFLVSSGIPGLSTPLGTYSIQRKEINHWSGYGLWMPYSLNFSGPYYIHELPYWPGGFREGESHLGHRASHGCVRLGIGPAKYVYEWADMGTPVYIHK